MFGMPPGFEELLQRKYNIMQQQADSGLMAARAASNLDTVKAGLMPAESRAQIEKMLADRGLINAQAATVAETTKYVGPLARADIGYKSSASGLNRANSANIGQETESKKQINSFFDIGGMNGLDAILKNRRMLGMGL
jgi:hypothetical protein